MLEQKIEVIFNGVSVTLEAGYSPMNEPEPYMNHKHLVYFKHVLETWKSKLQDKVSETLAHISSSVVLQHVPEDGDMNSNASELFTELRSEDRCRKLVHKIDNALLRIETGEYGYCSESNEPIGIPRLMARPVATLCIAMQELHETKEDNDESAKHTSEMMAIEED